MAKKKQAQDPKKTLTPVGTLSYPHLFVPQPGFKPGDEPKYGAVIVFKEGTDLSAMKAAANAAVTEKWGDKVPKGLRSPFRDAEEASEAAGYPENSIFVNCKTGEKNGAPVVVTRYQDPETGKPSIITEPRDVYAGMEVIFHVSAYAYDTAGNKGVAFALNGVQKWADGTPIGGRVNAINEFSAEAPVVGSLGDMDEDEDGEEEGDTDSIKSAFM